MAEAVDRFAAHAIGVAGATACVEKTGWKIPGDLFTDQQVVPQAVAVTG